MPPAGIKMGETGDVGQPPQKSKGLFPSLAPSLLTLAPSVFPPCSPPSTLLEPSHPSLTDCTHPPCKTVLPDGRLAHSPSLIGRCAAKVSSQPPT